MIPIKIDPIKRLSGELEMPGDKSISHRALMCGALAEGETVARGVLDCDDCNYTARAFSEMGVRIERDGVNTVIRGVGLNGLKKPGKAVDVGNSGTSMRVLAGILAGQKFDTTLTGAEGLSKRPMKRIIEPLSMMGSDIKASPDGFPPLIIKPHILKSVTYKMPVASAQVKSAILFAGLYASGVTTVIEKTKSRDHTERMLKHFGADVKADRVQVSVSGDPVLKGKALKVPGDISSASFFLSGAALLKGSNIKIRDVSINPTRAGILALLKRMGAVCATVKSRDEFEPYGDIEAACSSLSGIDIGEDEIPSIIDELPIIFVLASLAKGKTVIRGAGELKVKETDRIASMKENLEKMGGRISVSGDSIVIDGVSGLRGASLKSYGDHRSVMAMSIAALTADGSSTIDDIGCINKSFPDFFKLLESIKC